MKNLKLAVIALAAAGGLSACTSGVTAQKASFVTTADSVSYAIGLANFPPQLRSMLIQQFGDSTLIDDMIKGVQEGFTKTSEKEKAYAMGYNLGQSIATDMTKQIHNQMFQDENAKVLNSANFLSAFIDLAKGNTPIIADANEYLKENLPKLQEEVLQEKHGAYKKENEDFLTENAKKEGIITTESGLQYKVLQEGTGETIKEDQTVQLSYEGKLIDGTVFDSNENAEFNGTNGLVKGFKEALEMMNVGSKYEVYIPQELAYGTNPAGDKIKPYSTLVFTIEIKGIENK